MKLQRTTIILLLLALGLGVFVYYYETQRANQLQQAKAKEPQIFSFEADEVQSLRVKTKEQTLLVERGDSGKAKWLMKSPTETAASDASVFYLLDLLVKGKSDRAIQVPTTEIREYGLDQPQATIDVKLRNQKTHQLILGKPDFNHNFLYARADPPAKPTGNVDVLLVSTDFENAVSRPLSEWKSPDARPSTSTDKTTGASTTQDSTKASPSPAPAKDARPSTSSDKTTGASTTKDSTKTSPSPAPAKDARPSTSSDKTTGASTTKDSTKASPSPAPAKKPVSSTGSDKPFDPNSRELD